MNLVSQHPVTTRGAGVGLAISLVLGLLNHFGITLDPGVAGLAVTAGTSAVVFVGHEGIAGAWNRLLHGDPAPEAVEGSTDANIGGGGKQ